MNWDALGAIGEVVGAIAVVVSLLYLAVQIRAQNRESQVAAAHEILAAFRGMQIPLQDPGLAELWEKAVMDFESLNGGERIQIFAVVGPMTRVWEEAYVQFRSGRLDDETWEMMIAQFRDLMSMAAFQEFWEKRQHVYSKRFATHVDSIEPGENKFIGLYQIRGEN